MDEKNASLMSAAEGVLRIEPAGLRDFWILYRLEKLCFGRDAWPWVDVLAALTTPGAVRFKARLGERVVGFVVGDRRTEVGWIATIGVHPEYRRRGVASQLLLRCEQALGCRRVRLVLRPSNQGAYALYLRHGYELIERWPGYYRDGEEAWVMEKILRP
jgi:ribosomal-protein-alanine N-acetyltransferase